MTLTVNFFAGPGAGKSTLAAFVYARLKQLGYDVEMAREWMKDQVWEGRTALFDPDAQPYIFGKQWYTLQRLQGKVEAVITDGPIFLSLIYGRRWANLAPLVVEAHKRLTNHNVLVERVKPFHPAGRLETEEQARRLDAEIERELLTWGIPFVKVKGDEHAVDTVVGVLRTKLDQQRILRESREYLGAGV